jgi:hypothetical protein
MKHASGLALLALASCLPAAAAAPPYIPVAGLHGFGPDGGFGFYRHRHGRLSLYLSGGFGLGYSPYAFGLGYSPYAYAPVPNVSVVTVYSVQPTVVMPVPVPQPVAPAPIPPPAPEEPPPAAPPPPAAEEPQPLPPPKNPPPPKKEAPQPKPAVRPAPRLPPAPRPELDPKDEAVHQVETGKADFAAGLYGLAAFHFRQALADNPDDTRTNFLLGQALFALGKYPAAVAAVHEGLRFHPDWPTSPLRPLELYGDNVADYPAHLARLEAALTRNPDDPVLLFLYAYELWFDGRQDEAVPLFQRAARRAPDPTDSQRFLGARPPEVPTI